MTPVPDPAPTPVPLRTAGILDRLAALRTLDAPTHGGRVLSYVYDPGLAELDELAAAAVRAVQPLNGLDPTTFRSVGVMERELVAFARDVLGGAPADGPPGDGPDDVVGAVTTGGTESCLLAVKAAREAWRERTGNGPGSLPRLVAPTTVHAAFHKAALYLDLRLDLVPVDPATGAVRAQDLADRLDAGDGPADVALVVVSAPSYPFGAVDPVPDVAALAAARGVPLHVDACVGGFVLPFWPDDVPPFDLSVPGVTSLSADVHKYGYAPKGASVLLVRGRDHQRRHAFATTRWPGYPVVNATVPGSRSVGPLAAAWAVTQALGPDGYRALAARCAQATARLAAVVGGVRGLRVVGAPTGPLLAVATDDAVPAAERVDPHVWADEVRRHGFVLQPQPGLRQDDGTVLPHTTHLTVTPVTLGVADELAAALVAAADAVRGRPRPATDALVAALPPALVAPGAPVPGSDAAWAVLRDGLLAGDGSLPAESAPLLALVEALPDPLVERLLVEVVARVAEPVAGPVAAADARREDGATW